MSDDSRKIRFGLWYDFRNPAQWRQPADRLYREILDQIAWGENNGYDDVWLSEHHFIEDGYLPSILPAAAAIAARTNRIRIASGVLLMPFHNPIRLAEDIATVDVISGGRFVMSVADRFAEYAVGEIDLLIQYRNKFAEPRNKQFYLEYDGCPDQANSHVIGGTLPWRWSRSGARCRGRRWPRAGIGAASERHSALRPPIFRTHQNICNSAAVTSNDAAPRGRLHIAITPPSTWISEPVM
jgi:hypothetical protein